jgi:hypothetical protein
MSNKLKGIVFGFVSFFAFGVVKRLTDSGYQKGWEEFGYFPFFLGILGLFIGFLIGASIKEKK